MAIGTYISKITLNVNGLNAPSKRHKTHICAVYKKPTSDLKTHLDWKWEDGKIYSMPNRKQKKAGVAILISDKIDLKINKITRDKEGHT